VKDKQFELTVPIMVGGMKVRDYTAGDSQTPDYV